MTATHSIASTVLVAIDISKHRHEVLIGVPGKKRRRRITIMNTLEDFQRLCAAMDKVVAPDMVAVLRPEADAGSVVQPEPCLLRLFRWHLQPLPFPQPFDTAIADLPACVSQQCSNTAVAVAAVLPGQLDHVGHKPILVFPASWLISV